MRQARGLTRKHGMVALMIPLKEAEIKAEAIPVHMKKGQTETKNLKYKGEIPTGTVYMGQINKTTKLFLLFSPGLRVLMSCT